MTRPGPLTGGEKETLHFSLNRHRDAVLWKVEGLSDEQLRRPMTPSGTNLIGLVKHLAERGVRLVLRHVRPCGRVAAVPRRTTRRPTCAPTPDETTAEILDYYGRARTAADRTIDELDLEDTGTAWSGETVSLRWVLVHMIEETARHAGHMDILRELIDGETGDHRPA